MLEIIFIIRHIFLTQSTRHLQLFDFFSQGLLLIFVLLHSVFLQDLQPLWLVKEKRQMNYPVFYLNGGFGWFL
jgi:uncharacterized membrane protein (DUF373 family)